MLKQAHVVTAQPCYTTYFITENDVDCNSECVFSLNKTWRCLRKMYIDCENLFVAFLSIFKGRLPVAD